MYQPSLPLCGPSDKTGAVPAVTAPTVPGPGDLNYVYPNFPDAGYRVRTARKNHRCHGVAAQCGGVIEAGERYAVGESDPDAAGGFGRRMYCARCMAVQPGSLV